MNINDPQISSVEVNAVVNELSFLEGSKLDQVYQPLDDEFFFQFYAGEQGKQVLRVKIGDYVYLTDNKPSMDEHPPSFCMRLRKFLNGGTIKSVEQVGSQRVLKLVVQKREKFVVYFELFSKGNMVVCDSSDEIVMVFEEQSWESREVEEGIDYFLPSMDFDLFEAGFDDFKELISDSEKDEVVVSLAVEVGLGGLYAEEVCSRAGVDKTVSPSEVDVDSLWDGLNVFINELVEPIGFVSDKIISPVILETYDGTSSYDSFNEAVDFELSKKRKKEVKSEKEELYEEKLSKLKNIVKQQEQSLEDIKGEIEENKEKGELIYENYQSVKELFDKIEDLKEDKGWEEAREVLEEKDFVKSVDLKNKKITIDI